MAEINLDTARAARAEQRSEEHSILIGGQSFALPPELPMRAAVALDRGDVEEAGREIFTDRWDEVWDIGWSRDDFIEFVKQVLELYGGSPNSPASGSSS